MRKFIPVLLAALLCAAACQTSNTPRKPVAAKRSAGLVPLKLDTPKEDAAAACARGDFYLWALQDADDGVLVTPSYNHVVGRLPVQNLGYTYNVKTFAYPADKLTYDYVTQYNDAVLDYMRRHPRNAASSSPAPAPVMPGPEAVSVYEGTPRPAPAAVNDNSVYAY